MSNLPKEVREAMARAIFYADPNFAQWHYVGDKPRIVKFSSGLQAASDHCQRAVQLAREKADAALSALGEAGYAVVPATLQREADGMREALVKVAHAMSTLIHEGVDRGKGHWPAWDDCARAVDAARAALNGSDR